MAWRGLRHDVGLMVGWLTMLNPFEGLGSGFGGDPSLDGLGGDRFRWLPWVQLALTAAMVVLFVNQMGEFRAVNRRIAGLHQRMDVLEKTRIPNSTAALEAQQRSLRQSLTRLEAAVRDLAAADLTSPQGQGGVPAFQLPPPPPPASTRR